MQALLCILSSYVNAFAWKPIWHLFPASTFIIVGTDLVVPLCDSQKFFVLSSCRIMFEHYHTRFPAKSGAHTFQGLCHYVFQAQWNCTHSCTHTWALRSGHSDFVVLRYDGRNYGTILNCSIFFCISIESMTVGMFARLLTLFFSDSWHLPWTQMFPYLHRIMSMSFW